MRISDWSSDVCSSDLLHADQGIAGNFLAALGILGQAEVEVPAARTGNWLQLHFLQLQAPALGVTADQTRIETQVRTQSAELFLALGQGAAQRTGDRKSTRLNSSH